MNTRAILTALQEIQDEPTGAHNAPNGIVIPDDLFDELVDLLTYLEEGFPNARAGDRAQAGYPDDEGMSDRYLRSRGEL